MYARKPKRWTASASSARPSRTGAAAWRSPCASWPVYASTGEQILPVIMDDNYFTLLAGETRKVDIEIDESLLGEDTYKLVARPYND